MRPMVAGRGRCQAKLGSRFLTLHEHVDRACTLQVLPELLLCGFAHDDDLLRTWAVEQAEQPISTGHGDA